MRHCQPIKYDNGRTGRLLVAAGRRCMNASWVQSYKGHPLFIRDTLSDVKTLMLCVIFYAVDVNIVMYNV